MDQDQQAKKLRSQLISGLAGGESHIGFEQVVNDFPAQARGAKPPGAPHTAWELLEHMRIAQRDILDFSRGEHYKPLDFPRDYWPKESIPPGDGAWDRSVAAFLEDQNEFASLLQRADLFAPVPNGGGQTLVREAMVLANHNSYHLGELVFLKRMLEGK